MGDQTLINQCAVTVEAHTQLINALNNIKMENYIKNHSLIHANIIISVINVTVGNQIRALNVDSRIILLQVFQNRTLRIRDFTGAQKILKHVRTDKIK